MVGLNSLRNAGKFTGAALSVILLLLFQRVDAASAHTQTNEASTLRTPAQFAQLARTNFFEAQQRHRQASEDPTRGWEFARACFDLGDFATNNSERAEVAQQAITLCRALLAKNPRLLEARYYLAMNLGQLARTKSLGALKLVDEMERE